jgi:hypothetical protein
MTIKQLSQEEWDLHQRLLTDFPFFSRHIIKIEPKDLQETDENFKESISILADEDSLDGTIPLLFHPGQLKLYAAIKSMQDELGFIRIAMVKPRQVGWSTLIQSYLYWRATMTKGMRIHIVSHNTDSTRQFLRRFRKICKGAPAYITPGRPVDNSKEIILDNGASVSIATAGTPDAIRSSSFHAGHLTEEPSWPEPEATMAALMPALSDGPNSICFREATSKGKGTPWHRFIQDVQTNQTEWRLFFDAWFSHPKYQTTPPLGWQPNEEALEAQRLYNLTLHQLFWRANKIKSLGALWLFKQEYPGTVEESFQASANTLYNPDTITRARKNDKNLIPDPYAPLIMGVDPARTGDRTVIAFRQGKVVREVRVWPKMDDMRLVGIIATYLKDGYNGKAVSKCFIDYAIGEGPASRLRELGFYKEVQTVHFGETPSEERYANKRIEMAMNLRDWLGDTGEHVAIPDSDDIAADLLAIPDFVNSTGSEKLKLPPKDLIKKEYGRSPDIFDAIILTFAYPVAGERPAALHEFARNNLAHLPPSEFASILKDFES